MFLLLLPFYAFSQEDKKELSVTQFSIVTTVWCGSTEKFNEVFPKENLKFKIEGFKTQRDNNWQSSVDRLDNGEPANYDPIKLGKAVHYPYNPSKPVAKGDILNNNYSNNSTVQYVTKNNDGEDVIRTAIITNYGVIY